MKTDYLCNFTVPKFEVKGEDILTVVMATDNIYAPYAGVTICSMLENSSSDVYFDVVIMDDGISQVRTDELLLLLEKYANAQIRFLPMKDFISDAPKDGRQGRA